MEKLMLIALIGSVTALLMRTVRLEYAVLIGCASGAILLLGALSQLTGIRETMQRICETYSVPIAVLATVVKILGIAYLTEFGVNVARDAGQQTIAGGLLIGGKVLILSCTLPSAAALLALGASLIREASP